jgi:preprotein translocase subunit SecA
MLDGVKEESVGFLFNVTVEAAPTTPAPAVAPIAAPTGLAEFAAEAAAKAQEGAVATKERPATPAPLRAKGIEDEAPPLTYSGPSEDGSVQRSTDGGGGRHAAPAGGGSRRERREAARKQAKSTRRRG